MHTSVSRIQRIIGKLQDIVDEAESRGADEVKTCPNTYLLNSFISFEADGFLDLDCNVDDLFDDEED